MLSPLTTDAVGGDNAKKEAEALWQSPRASQKHLGKSNALGLFPNTFPPNAPSLLVDDNPANNHSRSDDRLPSIIIFRTRICDKKQKCPGGLSYDDSDEVSLLADDPDEDDEGVLPPSTYDVVVNILDEIDRDDNENAFANAGIE